MINSDWSYEALYSKAKIYLERAFLADRNSSQFPFWASLALELVGRATLAKIHPALIADPREGNNILHAFGYGNFKEPPKTIGAKTIFLRLQVIIPEFSIEHEKFCQSLINMRNEELHTGTPIFEDYSTNAWLTKFYKALKILLTFQEKKLEDLIGTQEAEVAEQMISEYDDGLVSKVFERIKRFKEVFNYLEQENKAEKIEFGKNKNFETVLKEKILNLYKRIECPSCENEALLIGKFISQSEPKVIDDIVKISHNILPVELRCNTCSLKIIGSGELTAANLGGQFALEERIDPVDYYGIEFDAIEELKREGYTLQDLEQHFYYDYGND